MLGLSEWKLSLEGSPEWAGVPTRRVEGEVPGGITGRFLGNLGECSA